MASPKLGWVTWDKTSLNSLWNPTLVTDAHVHSDKEEFYLCPSNTVAITKTITITAQRERILLVELLQAGYAHAPSTNGMCSLCVVIIVVIVIAAVGRGLNSPLVEQSGLCQVYWCQALSHTASDTLCTFSDALWCESKTTSCVFVSLSPLRCTSGRSATLVEEDAELIYYAGIIIVK